MSLILPLNSNDRSIPLRCAVHCIVRLMRLAVRYGGLNEIENSTQIQFLQHNLLHILYTYDRNEMFKKLIISGRIVV